jgi:hypothetical protein
LLELGRQDQTIKLAKDDFVDYSAFIGYISRLAEKNQTTNRPISNGKEKTLQNGFSSFDTVFFPGRGSYI